MMLFSHAGVLLNECVVTILTDRICWNSRWLVHVHKALTGFGFCAWIAGRIEWAAHRP
jgi:hypothetical protein